MFSFLKNATAAPQLLYLVSTAGLPNYGDEFITRGWLEYLAKRRPNDEIWLDCSNPGHAALLFNGIHPHLHIVNTLWQLVWNTRDLTNSHQQVSALTEWIRHGGTPREDLGIDVLRAANSIHFLGGGYVNRLWEANTLLFVAAATVKEVNPSVSLYATGLGLYPLEGDALSLVRSSFDSFDSVTVRDQESAALTDAALSCDDAFLRFDEAQSSWQDTDINSRAFICLQHDVIGENKSAIPNVLEALSNSGITSDETLTLVEALPPDDAWALDLFQKNWHGKVVLLPFNHLWSIGFPVSNNAVWISSRFHMHLIAAATGAHGIALEFRNNYYHIKHQSLLDIGTGWSTLDCSDATTSTSAMAHATAQNHFPQKANSLFRQKINEADGLYDTH